MILIYTALLAIPDELIDAATVDGLNQFQAFFYVKLPLIWPTIGLVSVLTFVNNFNAFDLDLCHEGCTRRSQLLGRHHGHVVLPRLLRQPVADWAMYPWGRPSPP